MLCGMWLLDASGALWPLRHRSRELSLDVLAPAAVSRVIEAGHNSGLNLTALPIVALCSACVVAPLRFYAAGLLFLFDSSWRIFRGRRLSRPLARAQTMHQSLDRLHQKVLESVTFESDSTDWVFAFSGGVVLRVSASWRLVAHGKIALGWQDDGQWFGRSEPLNARQRLAEEIAGKHVESMTISAYGDMKIEFHDSAAIEVFNDSCGYEGWQLLGPDNRCIVAQGGGNVFESGE